MSHNKLSEREREREREKGRKRKKERKREREFPNKVAIIIPATSTAQYVHTMKNIPCEICVTRGAPTKKY